MELPLDQRGRKPAKTVGFAHTQQEQPPLHPCFRGLCPQPPTTRRCRQQPEHQRCPATPDIIRICSCQGTFRYPSPLRGEHMLTFPLDSSPICSKTEEIFVFEGLFLETFFSDNILIMSLRKYIYLFSSMRKKGEYHICMMKS